MGTGYRSQQLLEMVIMPRLGKAFLLLTIAMVESQHGPMDMVSEECCTEKMVGSVSYTLLQDAFHGAIPHQCLNACVYTVTGTSSPKFCFQRGDLPTECLSDVPEIELVGGSGPHEGNVLVRGEPVCDDQTRPENAQVVCRQLGYLGGQVTVQSHFGQVSDVFAMDNVVCTGNEASFVDCPHVTEDNCGGHEGFGVICSNGVDVGVQVKSATTNQVVEGVSVQFTIGDQQYDLSTDSNGLVVFTLSPDAPLGQSATIVVSGDGYVSVSVQRLIRADVSNPLINIFTSPELAEGEHRLVLSWDTDTDLDIYAMGMDKTTGEIVCKSWYADGSGCAGVNLDVDTYGFGPETMTWTDADNDAYIYMLYVHDYDGNGVAGTGARITLYGETAVEMEVAGGDTGELWWTLGTFEPSVGTPSFLSSDQLQTSDPDSRNGRSIISMRKNKARENKKTKEDEPLKNTKSKGLRKAHKPQAHKPQAKLKARQAKLNAIEKQKANEQIGTSV